MSLFLLNDYYTERTTQESSWETEMNVAGLDPKELSIEFRDRKLIVKHKDRKLYFCNVPQWVDTNTISSSYNYGLLKIFGSPRSESLSRQIEIVQNH